MADQPRRHARAGGNGAHGRRLWPANRHELERGFNQRLAAGFFGFSAIGTAISGHACLVIRMDNSGESAASRRAMQEIWANLLKKVAAWP
jgi:hypothetical protein